MPTRQIFFEITPVGQAIFYGLSLLSMTVCFYGFYRRFVLWQHGIPFQRPADVGPRLRALAAQMFGHRRIRRRTFAGAMHLLLFYGMVVLFLGTNIVAVEHYGALVFGEHWLYRGAFYLACKLTLDVFGMGLLVATGLALGRRLFARPPSLGHDARDIGFLLLLFAATVTGFLLEGAGIASDSRRAAFAGFSPIGAAFAVALHQASFVSRSYPIAWWIHAPLVLGLIAALPYGRWLHLFVVPVTITLQPERPMGTLMPLDMPRVEETGRVGIGALQDMSRWELMSLDGCMECGRCTDACPARAVGKVLDPKMIVLDLRNAMSKMASAEDGGAQPEANLQSTDIISDEALWACTNCHACVRECPALIRHVDIIDGIRRYRVAEGRVSGSAATMLRQLTSRENPWGLQNTQRLDWARDHVPGIAAADDEREVLFWVGCAGAFDPRAQKTTQAIAQLLQKAGVKFTVLGARERCTGDPARRTGDELLFQQLAEANVSTLKSVNTGTILTQCPHCMHTIKNEYPQFGGNFEVLHHTQFLDNLVRAGRLKLQAGYEDKVTYHDPCFLARVNGETAAPRALLGLALSEELAEPDRRESKTFCCGAGGGRMWMEEPVSQRPGIERVNELMRTGAGTIAVGCPFCKVMVGDCAAQAAGDGPPPAVRDVAEILLASLAPDSAVGQ